MKFLLLVCFAIALLFSQSSSAYFHGQGQGVGKTTKSVKNNSKVRVKNSHQAAQIAKKRFGGKVLKVSKKNSKSGSSYRVKLVKENGHVVSVLVDAKTGKIRGK